MDAVVALGTIIFDRSYIVWTTWTSWWILIQGYRKNMLTNMIWRSPDCSFDISDTQLYKRWTSNVDICDIRDCHFTGQGIDATSTNYEQLITVGYTIIWAVLMALQTRTRKPYFELLSNKICNAKQNKVVHCQLRVTTKCNVTPLLCK